MTSSDKVCVIVDAYSSGNYLSPEFQSRGYRCVHVQSTPEILPIFQSSFKPSHFSDNIVHQGSVGETLRLVGRHNPRCLIAGSEAGVELADLLSEALGLPSNATRHSRARRDKFEMQQALRRNELRGVDDFTSDSLPAVLSWVRERGRWPVVLKPRDSAGTDCVTFCRSEAEVARAFHTIIGKRNRMGRVNGEVLVQAFLEGQQYIVNSVSCRGRHYICEIWRCEKKYVDGASYVYDVEELLEREGPEQGRLADYVEAVLDALSIRNGPAHSEIVVTKDGPVLVEVAARLQGGITPEAVTDATGHNQVSLTVDSYVAPEEFLRFSEKPYQLRKHVFCVGMIAEAEGYISALPGADELKRLPSFFSLITLAGVGDRLQKTVDLFTSPGIIYLVHEDRRVLEHDYQLIRRLEKNGFYRLARTACEHAEAY